MKKLGGSASLLSSRTHVREMYECRGRQDIGSDPVVKGLYGFANTQRPASKNQQRDLSSLRSVEITG